MTRSHRLVWPTCILTFAATMTAVPALAQAAGGNDTSIETVVVTAQKHAELLSKAPIAVSAISQKGLDKLSITTPQDLVSTVPDLQTSVNGYSTQFQIRGIGNDSGSYAVVATQIDGVYASNPGALNTGMYDVSRVEVARGPQGTVYGRNATAGVVNIITNDPVNELQVFGDASYGNYNDFTARGVVNVPLSDSIAVRASIVREFNDGYYPAGAAADKYNSKDVLTARLTLLAKITPDLVWRLSLEHNENTGTIPYLAGINYLYYPNANLATGVLGTPVVTTAPKNLYNQEAVTDNRIRTQSNVLRSKLTWNATDSFTISYLAGFTMAADNGITSATGVFWSFGKGNDTQAMSHEIDFNYDTDKLKIVAGAYLYWDNAQSHNAIVIGNTVPYGLTSHITAPLLNNPTGYQPSAYGLIDVAANSPKNGNQSEAVFGQVTYSVLDTLRLTAGIRYTQDWHNVDSFQTVCLFKSAYVTSAGASCTVPFGSASETYQATKSNNISWRLGADYDLNENQLLFASVSTGYRAGGVSGNSLLPVQYLTYKPEKVTNYEAGWKAELLDRSVGLGITVFNMDYTNMQVSAIEHDLNNNPTPVTINAAKSRIKGAEFEWQWRLTGSDTISGYATYLDARFSSFPNAVDASTNPDGIYNTSVSGITGLAQLATNVAYDFTGDHLPNAPEESFRISYQHVFDLGSVGTLTPSIQLYWQDMTYNDYANNKYALRKPYTKSDFNLTYEDAAEKLNINFYIHNLENRPVWQIMNAKWDGTEGFLMPPRTYGLRLGYKLY